VAPDSVPQIGVVPKTGPLYGHCFGKARSPGGDNSSASEHLFASRSLPSLQLTNCYGSPSGHTIQPQAPAVLEALDTVASSSFSEPVSEG
jgi:hypothetical protein